jgi:membrane protein DedA with SNARE-associated domain
MQDQLHIGSGLSWAVAWLLVAAAIGGSMQWPGAAMWWISLVLVLPLICLAAWRQDRKGATDGTYDVVDGGPWTGPPQA